MNGITPYLIEDLLPNRSEANGAPSDTMFHAERGRRHSLNLGPDAIPMVGTSNVKISAKTMNSLLTLIN